jgi:hypothetical protein
MTVQQLILRGVAVFGVILAASASYADQLCHADGTGCMNVTWSCGSIAMPADLICLETRAARKIEVGNIAPRVDQSVKPSKVEDDIASMRRRKAKKMPILVDPKLQ